MRFMRRWQAPFELHEVGARVQCMLSDAWTQVTLHQTIQRNEKRFACKVILLSALRAQLNPQPPRRPCWSYLIAMETIGRLVPRLNIACDDVNTTAVTLM